MPFSESCVAYGNFDNAVLTGTCAVLASKIPFWTTPNLGATLLVSGDAITVHRRDGRLFTETQMQVLTAARTLVMTTNVDVETAIKQALDRPLQPAPVALAQSSALGSEALLKALTDAQREANAPLLGELRSIRESLERLERTQLVEPETAAQVAQLDKLEAATCHDVVTSKHGPVVRLALWLERVLRR